MSARSNHKTNEHYAFNETEVFETLVHNEYKEIRKQKNKLILNE